MTDTKSKEHDEAEKFTVEDKKSVGMAGRIFCLGFRVVSRLNSSLHKHHHKIRRKQILQCDFWAEVTDVAEDLFGVNVILKSAVLAPFGIN